MPLVPKSPIVNRSLVVEVLSELAAELDLDLVVEPIHGFVAQLNLADGRRTYFRGSVFDLNGAGATEIANDKDYAAYFLTRLGYPVPEGAAFFTKAWCKQLGSDRGPEQAWRYANSVGLPVYVKPNSQSQGTAIWLAHNRREFFRAVTAASRSDRVFLVQRPVAGKDFRIVLLDGEVMSAYERLPLSVVGDGRTSVAELLAIKQSAFRASGRDTTLRPDDPRIEATLKRRGLTLRSTIPDGQEIRLLPIANLSAGGDAKDVTESIDPAWIVLAASIAHDMNLRYAGIDVMTSTSITEPPLQYVVIEVNAAPGLDNYAAAGHVQRQRVRDLYSRVLAALADA